MIDISIIIPHYNSFETLEKLLNSIPKANNVEVIVIDDCSTKKSDLFSRAEYDHVIFIKTSKNSGAGAARNIGIEKAIGKYILFADADDYFLEGFLDIVMPYTQKEFDCIFFKSTSVCLNTGKIANRHIERNRKIDTYFLFKDKFEEFPLRFGFYGSWCKLIRLDFLKTNEIRFDNFIIAEDVMFSTKIGLNIKNFTVSKDIIYCVTTNDFSLTVVNIDFNSFNLELTIAIKKFKFLKDMLSKKDFNLACSLIGSRFLLSAIKRNFTLKEKIQVFKRLYEENMLKPNLSILLKKIYRRFISIRSFKNES